MNLKLVSIPFHHLYDYSLSLSKIRVLLFCIFISSQLFAQNEAIDSLNRIVNNTEKHDTAKAKAYVELSVYLFSSNPDTVVPLCKKSIEIIDALPKNLKEYPYSKEVKAMAFNNIGFMSKYYGDINGAIENYNASLKLKESISDMEGVSNTYINLGALYVQIGDLEKSIDFYHKALRIKEKIDDKKGASIIYNNIGIIYSDHDDPESALEYYNKSLDYCKEIDYKKGIALAYNNIGNIHESNDDQEKAITFHEKSLKINQEINNQIGQSNSYGNLAFSYMEVGDFKKALNYNQQANKLSKKLNNKSNLASSYFRYANIYFKQQKYVLAKNNLFKAIDLYSSLGFPDEISKSHFLLSKIFEKQGKYKTSLNHYKKYKEFNDSIKNEKNKDLTKQQKLKYAYDKQMIQDSIKNQEKEKLNDAVLLAREKEIAMVQYQKKALFGGLALVLIFGLFVFNRLRVSKRQNKIIENQKKEVELQRDLANQKHKEVELKKELLAAKNIEIIDSINYAKRIQDAILPSRKTLNETLNDGFVFYLPKDVVSGDFYWLETFSGQTYLAVADCTGHGVPGAMVSVICANSLSKALIEEKITSPDKILNRTRDLVVERLSKSGEDLNDGMDISLVSLARSVNIKPSEGSEPSEGLNLRYAGANNSLWIIRKREQLNENELPNFVIINDFGNRDYVLLEIKADKQPVGVYKNEKPFSLKQTTLLPGDSFYMFTDGYADQFGGEEITEKKAGGKKFKSKNLKKILLSFQEESMHEQKQILLKTFEEWRGTLEQIDDVCIIGVRV